MVSAPEMVCGPIAQLVERYTGSVEVSGSTPLGSTTKSKLPLGWYCCCKMHVMPIDS